MKVFELHVDPDTIDFKLVPLEALDLDEDWLTELENKIVGVYNDTMIRWSKGGSLSSNEKPVLNADITMKGKNVIADVGTRGKLTDYFEKLTTEQKNEFNRLQTKLCKDIMKAAKNFITKVDEL